VIIIEGGMVLTVDDAGHVHAPGHVVIDGDRIVAVGAGRYAGTEGVAANAGLFRVLDRMRG
jgi:cytosine/adenosine deaminase-related metal-dependent hydrolase